MTEAEKQKKLEVLSNDPAFLEAMKNVAGKDDIKKVFSEYGLDLTKEEVDAFVFLAEKEISGELSDAELENVAGGAKDYDAMDVFGWAWKGTKAIAKWCWKAGRSFANWEASW